MKVLLSINPEHVEKIFSGEKQFEYRKALFKNKAVSKVIIYATMPVGQLVGEFSIDSILMASPKSLWKETKSHSGISKKFFDDYFSNRHVGYAIKIGNLIKYPNPLNPFEKIHNFTAPQSFRYINEEIVA